MDSNDLMYLLGFILLILVVSRFMNGSESYSSSTSSIKSNHLRTATVQGYNGKIVRSESDIEFENIVNFLKKEVTLRYGKDKKEKAYQQNLEGRLSILSERYGYNVQYESVNGNHRVDFVINGNIGIEMKVHRGGTQVHKELFNQITDYAEYCSKLIGLVVNVTDDDSEVLRQEIKEKLKKQRAISEENYEIIVLNV